MAMIDIFTKRVEAATKAKSKEIRLNIDEAQRLVFEVIALFSKENELLNKIVSIQDDLLQKPKYYGKVSTPDISGDVVMDGGDFK